MRLAPDWIGSLSRRLEQPRAALASLGVKSWLELRLQLLRIKLLGAPGPLRLTSKLLDHPVYFRWGASDLLVFHQILVEREYSPLDDVQDPGLIIDCGANVGYSTAYFLSRFPSSTAIAIEPDPGNYEVLCRNLAPYGERARALNTAVWSRPTGLKLSTEKFRDGAEWSRHVVECTEEDASSIQATDLGHLLDESGFDRISILKMDIEGAEAVVFGENYSSWLDRVDCIAIELHKDSLFGDAPAVFSRAVAGQRFTMTRNGELTFCRRSPMSRAVAY